METHSFSGSDVVCTAALQGSKTPLADIQTISISTHRDTSPVRTLGIDRPIQYTQGTRTVSGTLVFTKIYESAFEGLIQSGAIAPIGDTRGYPSADRLVPFDIHMEKATEYGNDAESATLRGISLMTSGQVVSIHDVYCEQTYNYVALEFLDFGRANLADNSAPKQRLSDYYSQLVLGGEV